MTPGRNDPCPCGSGKKYKKCCADRAEATSTLRTHPEALSPAHQQINALVALYAQGRYGDVILQAKTMTAQFPGFGFGWKVLGAALQQAGNMADAQIAMRRATELLPDDAEAYGNLAGVLKKLGNLNEAEASYRHALKINPQYAEASYNFGICLLEMGRCEEAAACFARVAELAPGFAEAHSNLGICMMETRHFQDAEKHFRRAIELKPDFAEAYSNLGDMLRRLGRLDEAFGFCHRALEINPQLAIGNNNLGIVLYAKGLIEESEPFFRNALRIKPDFVEAYCNLAASLRSQVKFDEALEMCRRALELDPESMLGHLEKGAILRDLGRHEEAREAFKRAIEHDACAIEAHYALMSSKKIRPGDENMAALIHQEKEGAKVLSPLEEEYLHYALGKGYDDLGECDKAMPHFLRGAAIHRSLYGYSLEQDARLISGIIGNFDAQLIEKLRGVGESSELPIFILGMPRSGTTLVEQILSSHPEVYGAGELRDLSLIAGRSIGGIGYPDSMQQLDAQLLAAWGREYVAGLIKRAPGKRRITDKMPLNFLYAGLIHLMLPNAKIIHMVRNPVDTCLSCFTQRFSLGNEYSYDLAELGRYYSEYHRLMQHWRTVLPTGVMLDVQYEDVVADLEGQSRRIIEHCGLEWSDACLDFHKTNRPVQTASAMQVNQPIYATSVERWRRYEKFLGPLLDALGDLVPERSS